MKHILSALALSLAAIPAQAADKLPLSAISGYLNGITTARGDFTQYNEDGSRSNGTLYIKRPGKMRFEYNGKDAAKVVASAGAVVILDPKSNQPPETYPLRRTPLSIILADRVDLSQARMVTSHEFDGTATIVRAQDPKNPDQGSIDLRFTDNPVRLESWVIRDSAGGQTAVTLGVLDTGIQLKNSVFNVQALSDPPRDR